MATTITAKNPVLKKGYHRMTLDFGNTYSDGSFHKGIDLTGNTSVDSGYDYVLALEAGTVTSSYNACEGVIRSTGTAGMGNYVIIDHGNGFKTRYMHMKKGSVTVKAGQKVNKGQVIGYIGNTGNSTGRHLHFDLSKNGTYIDPKPYLKGTLSVTPTPTAPKYTTGNYVTTDNLNVRKGPGVNYAQVNFNGFTANAKEQVKALDKRCPNHFPKGMKLTISQVSGTWGKCPTGWVSLKYCKKV